MNASQRLRRAVENALTDRFHRRTASVHARVVYSCPNAGRAAVLRVLRDLERDGLCRSWSLGGRGYEWRATDRLMQLRRYRSSGLFAGSR